MSSAAQLQPVLDRIDADFANSLERLFALLRIKSNAIHDQYRENFRTARESALHVEPSAAE